MVVRVIATEEWREMAEEEAKLIAMPRGMEELRIEVQRFEEERGCELVGIRVRRGHFLEMCLMASWLKREEVWVRLDPEVREEGHVVLVGGEG